MELVYLWVEEYKNIKNQEFNFSPRFKCKYDGKNLTIDKNDDYVSIFPKNINITAIVGENGSGKSSILEALYLLSNIENNKVFCVYTSDYKKFYYQTNLNFIITSNSFKLEKDEIKTSYLGLSFIPNITQRILTAKSKEDRPSYTSNYKIEFLFKFIDVFKENNQIFKRIDEKFVFDKLKINIYREQLVSKKELKIQRGLGSITSNLPYEKYESFLLNTYKRINELIENAINPLKEDSLKRKIILSQMRTSSGDLILDVKISFIIQYMNNLVSLFSNIENINYEKFTSVQDIFNDLSFENLFEKIKEFEEKINFHQTHLTNIKKNIKLFEDWIQICEEHKDLFIQDNENYSLTVSLDNSLVREILNFKDLFTTNSDFNTFSLLSVDLLSYENGINFFGLSSGEQKRLSLYIEIIDSYFFSNSKILILDEPDTFLHPQWNKRFINDLIKSLPKENKKHLIITSHSPFILSDLPKENVIFLKDGKQEKPFKEDEQTFGANIHTLLSHGFFIEDGLMGEFAKSKINKIKKFYDFITKYKNRIFLKEKVHLRIKKYYKSNKKEFDYITSIIGEPFLQKIIKNYLDELEEIFDKENYKQKKLKMLVKEFGEDALREYLK